MRGVWCSFDCRAAPPVLVCWAAFPPPESGVLSQNHARFRFSEKGSLSPLEAVEISIFPWCTIFLATSLPRSAGDFYAQTRIAPSSSTLSCRAPLLLKAASSDVSLAYVSVEGGPRTGNVTASGGLLPRVSVSTSGWRFLS